MLEKVKFNEAGLVAAIAQCVDTEEVLMLAWMSRESLDITLRTQKMTYYSRSRQSLWQKGETSGHHQTMVSAHLDCDGDAILFKVNQVGSACHTGAGSCFFTPIDQPHEVR